MFEWLIDYFWRMPRFRASTKSVSSSDMATKIQSPFPKAQLHLMDNKSWLMPRAELEKAVFDDWTDKFRFIAERFDCADFAFHLKQVFAHNGVNSVGVVIDASWRHAYNIIMFTDGERALFEPQDDKFIRAVTLNEHALIIM